jgi:hypothetical protein
LDSLRRDPEKYGSLLDPHGVEREQRFGAE